MENVNELEDARQFYGTEKYYKIGITDIVATDGVKYMCDKYGLYWFTDIISSTQLLNDVKNESFQVWQLKSNYDGTALVTATNGNYKTIYIQNIDYTDFNEKEVTFWFSNNVILLPSEY